MKRILAATVATGVLMLASASTAAGADAVYQRMQSGGAVSLTNVPDSDAYQVFVTESSAISTTGTSRETGSSSAPTALGGLSPSIAPVLTQTALSPEPAAPRPGLTPLSIEARSGKLLDATVAPAAAASQASQARDQISSAGGAQARLLNLYQASMTAFQARRPVAPEQR